MLRKELLVEVVVIWLVLFVVVVVVGFRPNKRGLIKCVVVWFDEFDGYWYIGWCSEGGFFGPVSCKLKLIWVLGLLWITE